MKHVIWVTWTDTIQAQNKFENLKFVIYFLDKDIPFNIS